MTSHITNTAQPRLIERHPLYGTLLASTAAARFLSHHHTWMSWKLSEIELQKAILSKGEERNPKEQRKMKFLTVKNEIEVQLVARLSKSFFPLVIGTVAVYLDHKIFKDTHSRV